MATATVPKEVVPEVPAVDTKSIVTQLRKLDDEINDNCLKVDVLTKANDVLTKQRDALEVIKCGEVGHKANVRASIKWREQQNQDRKNKHAATTKLLAGVDLKSLNPRSLLDQALRNKKSRVGQRPTMPVAAAAG